MLVIIQAWTIYKSNVIGWIASMFFYMLFNFNYDMFNYLIDNRFTYYVTFNLAEVTKAQTERMSSKKVYKNSCHLQS